MADIVLVHGITESRHSWDPLLAPLSASHRVLAVDLPGHGSSTSDGPFDLGAMAGDVFATMAEAGFSPASSVLVGHSLGGTVVSAMASATSVRGVINVDQPLDLAGFQDGLCQLQPMLEGDNAAFLSAVSMVFAAMRGPLSDAESERIEAIRSPKQPVVLAVWSPVLHSSAHELNGLVRSMAQDISAPYLSLHGIDPGPAYYGFLTDLLPRAQMEVWADHGHYPHLVAPARFVDRVDSFVATLP